MGEEKENKKRWGEWIKKKVLSKDSKEYQRVLVGIRIFFRFLSRKTFLNSIITVFVAALIVVLAIVFWTISEGENLNLLFLIILIIFYPSSFFGLFTLTIRRNYKFRCRDGFKTFLREKNGILIIITFLILGIILGITNTISIGFSVNIIFGSLFVTFIGVFIKFSLLISDLKNEIKIGSYVDYNIEILDDMINNEENILIDYQLFYYGIWLYYKVLLKNLREGYREDILYLSKLDRILLLGSQVIYSNKIYRETVLKFLKDLRQVRVLKDHNKFVKIMNRIEDNAVKKFGNNFVINVKSDLIKEENYVENLRKIAVAIIPLITVLISYLFDYLL